MQLILFKECFIENKRQGFSSSFGRGSYLAIVARIWTVSKLSLTRVVKSYTPKRKSD